MNTKYLFTKLALIGMSMLMALPLSSCLSTALIGIAIDADIEAKENEKKNSFEIAKDGHVMFDVRIRKEDEKPRVTMCCAKKGMEKLQILKSYSFQSDDFETYVADSQDFDFTYTSAKGYGTELVSTKVKDKDGNEIEAPDKILPYMKALSSYSHDIISATFLYTERETFAIVNPNVNWVSPSDIIGFDSGSMFYYTQGTEEVLEVYGLKFLD